MAASSFKVQCQRAKWSPAVRASWATSASRSVQPGQVATYRRVAQAFYGRTRAASFYELGQRANCRGGNRMTSGPGATEGMWRAA